MVNRRERVRAATVQEIKDVARRQLVTDGPNAVSLRAIAREMGMTAPALYRYFPSFDHLVRALVADLYTEICAAMEDTRDLVPAEDVSGRLFAVCRTFRAWAVGHRQEFGLVFGSPLPGALPESAERGDEDSSVRVGRIFVDLFGELSARGKLADDAPGPRLTEQLAAYGAQCGVTMPVAALGAAVSTWMRVFGLVSLEVFGHLRFAPEDGEAFFESQLAELAATLGLSADLRPVQA